jgi:hypothetical protein
MAARAGAMSEQMERLRVTARDGDGLAEVTIDAAGVLVGLEFTDRIHRFAPPVVARAWRAARSRAMPRRPSSIRSARCWPTGWAG